MGEDGGQLEILGVGACTALWVWSLVTLSVGLHWGSGSLETPFFKSPTGDASVDSGERKEVPKARVPADIHSGGSGYGYSGCSGSSESDSQESPWGQ